MVDVRRVARRPFKPTIYSSKSVFISISTDLLGELMRCFWFETGENRTEAFDPKEDPALISESRFDFA
jgi:uncharacterized protein YodC (DUF2158 family)